MPSFADLAVEEKTERDNLKAKHTPYEEGDMVYMKVPKKERTKIQPMWTGPLEVKQRKRSTWWPWNHLCVPKTKRNHMRKKL
jgi:hypothetical protein